MNFLLDPIALIQEDSRKSIQNVPMQLLDGKTVLITGGSGLIGTHLLYGLTCAQTELGVNVRIIATTLHGVPPHLAPLEQAGGIEFLTGDLADHRFVEQLPPADVILHAATYGQPGMFMALPIETLRLNTEVTCALLEKVTPGGRFLFMSSSELYSGLRNAPFSEEQIGTTSPTHPRACYIEAKRCGEAICNAFRSQGLDAKSARVSLAYGPGTRPGDKRVINNIIEKALTGTCIELLDSGSALRTYCYIADAGNMLWRILLCGSKPVYNVGGISTVTIAEMAGMVGQMLGLPVIVPPQGGDGLAGAPTEVRLDLSRFIDEFGEIQFTGMAEGLRRTIAWYQSFVSTQESRRIELCQPNLP